MNLIDKVKDIFLGETAKESKKNNSNNNLKYIVIIGMIGVLLLLLADLFNNNNSREIESSITVKEVSREKTYEENLSQQLQEIISLIEGVGQVRVKVYVTSGHSYQYKINRKEINKNTQETDQSGGERQIVENNIEEQLVVLRAKDGGENPVIKQETPPVLSGVLIIAEGAQNSHIKYKIVRAVSSLFSLPVHKINVLPYQRR